MGTGRQTAAAGPNWPTAIALGLTMFGGLLTAVFQVAGLAALQKVGLASFLSGLLLAMAVAGWWARAQGTSFLRALERSCHLGWRWFWCFLP